MKARHAQTCWAMLIILSLAPLGACEQNLLNVLDEWGGQGKSVSPADEQHMIQDVAAQLSDDSIQAQNGSQSSPFSPYKLQMSDRSRNMFTGLLEALGLQASREALTLLETSEEEKGSNVRRRSAKENTIPHIIHQVKFLPCRQIQGCSC